MSDWLTEEMNRQHAAGIPNLDNLGAGVDYDGPRCDECRAPLPEDNGGDLCGECAECLACGGDGCDWHLSPTNGAIEIDRACPDCAGTGRTPR